MTMQSTDVELPCARKKHIVKVNGENLSFCSLQHERSVEQKQTMADISSDKIHNLTNMDLNYSNGNTRSRHLAPTQSLQRKISDQNPSHHHYQSSAQAPPMITTTDYSDPATLPVMRVSQSFSNRRNSDTGYDTDGGIGTTKSPSRSHRQDNHAYEHLVSPRLPTKRSTLNSSKVSPAHHSPHYTHLSVAHHHNEKVDESSEGEHSHRHHIRASRRIQHRSPVNRNHGATAVPRHNTALGNTTSGRPFRLVFIRHSERANQALGSDWFSKAFRTNTYKSYDPNLPAVLPKRNSDQAYEFDAPITGFVLIDDFLFEYSIYCSSWFENCSTYRSGDVKHGFASRCLYFINSFALYSNS